MLKSELTSVLYYRVVGIMPSSLPCRVSRIVVPGNAKVTSVSGSVVTIHSSTGSGSGIALAEEVVGEVVRGGELAPVLATQPASSTTDSKPAMTRT